MLTVNRTCAVGGSRRADVELTLGNADQLFPPSRLYDQTPVIEVVASVMPAAVMATPSWVPESRSTPMPTPWKSVNKSEARNDVVTFSNWVRMTDEVRLETTMKGRSFTPLMVTVRLAVAVSPTRSATV